MKYPILEKLFEGENPNSIFEVGCGVGGFLEDYRTLKGVAVGGIELNAKDLNEAKEKFPQYVENFILGDANQPWPIDRKYDIVFSIGTLILMPYPQTCLKEMLRIGKKVIIAEPHGQERYGVVQDKIYQYGYQYRCEHDYVEQFARLGVKIKIGETYLGKTIIKTI